MKKISNILLTLSLTVAAVSCSPETEYITKTETVTELIDLKGDATITFDAKVGEADFALDTPFTLNDQECTFTGFRYWVSNIELVNEAGDTYAVPNSYFLLEETAEVATNGTQKYPATKREAVDLVSVPSGKYTKIRFSVGVDQTHNDNMSIQDGELSQLNGMTNASWMWNTSYIFSTLRGTNTTAGKALKIDTGLNENYRTVELVLPSTLTITAAKTAKVNFDVDVAKVIEGVDFVAKPTIGASTKAEMTVIADNYRDRVFTLKSVE